MRASLAPLLVEVNRLQLAAGVYQCEAPQPPPAQPAEQHSAQPGSSNPAQAAERHAAPPVPPNGEPIAQSHNGQPLDPLAHWDIIVQDVDEPTVVSDSETLRKQGPRTRSQATDELVAVEKQTLHIPSNQNVTPRHDDVELALRKNQARSHLHQLRELIAEKSFHYSDILRKAPRKGVRTRARGTVKGINTQISFHCQVYSHCRARLIQLGVDAPTLLRFRELKKEDIKASTAVLTPNTRGSTALKLSWIWTDVSRHVLPAPDAEIVASDAATILECMWCSPCSSCHLTDFLQSNACIGYVLERRG